MFIAGVLILAVGLVQLGGDDEDGTASQPAERQAAQSAPAPTPPAEPAPTPAQLRTQARLRALGDRELGPGTVGDDVKALQRLLGVQQTGNFGELTNYALVQFQSTHDLPATGIADEATKRKLARRPRPPRQAPTPPAQEQQPATPDEAPGQTPQGAAPEQAAPATPPAGTPSTGQ